MRSPMNRINVAEELAFCVRTLGGVVSDDLPSSQSEQNADYIFDEWNVAVELKSLQLDMFSTEEFKRRVFEMHTRWAARGLVTPLMANEKRHCNLASIPEVCAREMLTYLKGRLEDNVLKKANSQLKSERKKFSPESGFGLLII